MSVQQELFPRASVEVGYYRRTFTQFTTGGTVTDNLAVAPSDVNAYTVTAPSDSRLPDSGSYTVGPLYNLTPAAFSRVPNNLFRSTKDVGDDTRVFNGVDVNFNLRTRTGLTFQGGTSTGKVVNDWCEVRAAVPEATSAPAQPVLPRRVAVPDGVPRPGTYVIPRIDVVVSSVYQDKTNIGTDQIVSLAANYTLTAADQAAAAAQIGRPLTTTGRSRST